MELSIVLGAVSLILLTALYFIQEHIYYWKKRGIPYDTPNLLLGNMKGVSINRHPVDPLRDLYKKYKGTGPFCGLYFFINPAVLILDLELVKNVLIKDFNKFIDRGFYYNEKGDPLSAHLFNLDGVKWRQLRNKLTPTFTSGKMKFMFPTVVEVANRFIEVFGENVGKGSVIEVKELNARFTTDVIGTCAFGLDCNSLSDPKAQFRIYGRKMLEEKRHHPVIISFIQSCPKIARKLGMKVTKADVEEFFMSVVKNTVEYREKNNIKRNDFMNILIELKNNSSEMDSSLTIEEIAAQVFVFYLAGFETSSSTMSYAMIELARNTEVQDKLRAEVNDIMLKNGGELTYESILEMHYLDQVIDETLRMYPVVPFLQRRAVEDYQTDDPKYKIEKGSLVFIPVEPIHFDPEIYENPTKFDPDRFSSEEKTKRDSTAWLSFGLGPRNCVGLRFGKMQTRIGLALLIKNFKFTFCDKTKYPLKYSPKTILLQTTDGLFLNVERI